MLFLQESGEETTEGSDEQQASSKQTPFQFTGPLFQPMETEQQVNAATKEEPTQKVDDVLFDDMEVDEVDEDAMDAICMSPKRGADEPAENQPAEKRLHQ